MRTHFVKGKQPPLQLEAPAEPKHAPLLPMLQEVAQRKQMRLHEDLTNRDWSSPQCVLSWTTSKGVACTFYLVGGPGDFRVDLLCWQRNRIVARKQWKSYSMNATNEIRRLLEAMSDWTASLD